MPDVLALSSDQVHVWCANPDELAKSDAAAPALLLLSDDERLRLERHHFERDRRLFLATRTLVRRVLSRYEAVAPAAWRFAPSAEGRPEIAGRASSLRFNLSNTHGLVVCAVARVDVGIDVEPHGRDAPLEVAERFFAPFELAALAALPPAEKSRRFFDYWTLKESYLKARGLGLALPLDRFWFVVEPGSAPRIVIDPALGDDAARWQFMQCRPTDDHLVSLCVLRPVARDAEVTVRWQALA